MILSDISYKVTKNNIGNLRTWLEEESPEVDAELYNQQLCKLFDDKPRCFISSFKMKKKKVVFVTFLGSNSSSDWVSNFKLTVFNYI